MSLITRNVEVNLDLTPQELAQVWCNMPSQQQAAFFNEIADIADKWEGEFCMQLQWITDEECLNDSGRAVMRQIGEYSAKAPS